MSELQRVPEGSPLHAPPRARPARADVERLLGLVLDAASRRARIWFEADDAADVAQDVGLKFLKAWEADPGFFNTDVVPVHWVAVAVRHATIDLQRTREAREFADVPADPARDNRVESGADVAADAESFELERHLAEALNALSVRQRNVWLLVHDHGMSYAETARELGISIETVKAYLARATQLMRAAVARYEGRPNNG